MNKLRIKSIKAKHGEELQVGFQKQDGQDWFSSSVQIVLYPANIDSRLQSLGTIANRAYGAEFGDPRVFSLELFYFDAERSGGNLASLQKVKATIEVDNLSHKKERSNLPGITQEFCSDGIESPHYLSRGEYKAIEALCNSLGKAVSEELVRESQCEPVQMSLGL